MILVDSQKRVCYDSIKALENGHSSCQEFTFSPESIEMKSYLVLCPLILGLSLALVGQTLADKDLVLYFPFDQQGGKNADKNSGYVMTFFHSIENRLVLHYNMNDFAGKGFVLPFDDKWHHIAVVLDSTVKGVKAIQMYLDGNAEEVVKWFLPAPAGVPLTPNDVKLKIGCGNNAWNYFKGSLDDVVMFSRALSENEVKDLASSPYSVTPAGKLSVSWGFIKKSY